VLYVYDPLDTEFLGTFVSEEFVKSRDLKMLPLEQGDSETFRVADCFSVNVLGKCQLMLAISNQQFCNKFLVMETCLCHCF